MDTVTKEELNRMILAGTPPKVLRSYFKNKEDALRYYAHTIAEAYSHPNLERCDFCGAAPGHQIQEAYWSALLRIHTTHVPVEILVGHGASRQRREHVSMVTRHSCCEDCAKRHGRMRFWKAPSKALAIVCSLFALGFWCLGGMFLVDLFGPARPQSLFPAILNLLLAMLATAAMIHLYWKSRGMPKALRSLVRRPFKFYRLA